MPSLVGSEMCIRDRVELLRWDLVAITQGVVHYC